MVSYNYRQHVKEPTRITENTSTCLDLIFSRISNYPTLTSVNEFGFSDHKGVIFSIRLKLDSLKKIVIFKRIFNETNINKFKEQLQSVKWKEVLKADKNINENYDIFITVLKRILDKTIPKKEIKIQFKHRTTWLTKGIKTSCKNKRFLKNLLSHTNNETIHAYYKKYEKLKLSLA